MPLPPTRYIDAGPGVPLANPNSAMLQGEAMARMGNTIAAIGQRGFEIAGQLRRVDDGRKMMSLFSNMEKEAAEFSIGLMKREDTEAWKGEYADLSKGWKERAREAGLSPEGMAAFEERFSRWDTRQGIHFETLAANKSIEMARATFENSTAFHLSRRNYGAALEDVETARASGWLSTPEAEKARMTIEQTQQHNTYLDDINEDPRGWKQRNPIDKPPPGYDPIKWRQLHNHASSVEHENDVAVSDDLLDGIVTGKISNPDQVREKGKNLRPLQQQKIIDALEKWNAEGAQAKRQDPANIAANVGKFYAALDDWKPDEEGQDPAGVELRMLIEELPEGHPLRDKMRESMNARKNRIEGEVKTRADQGIASLKLAAERGDFGPVKVPEGKPIETRAAVKDGFLKDVPKLQSLGFSQDQGEQIREAAAKDPALGQKTFNDLWKARPQGSANAAPFDIAVADALRNGNGTLQWKAAVPAEEMASHEAAAKAYGEAVIEFNQWIKLNPNASEADMGAKLRELGSKSARVEPQTSGPVKRPPAKPGTAPQPGETSMRRDPNVNPNVYNLWETVSAQYPSVDNWGIWGDEKHKQRKSDHNTGDAIDIAIKDNDGPAVAGLIEANAAAHNVKYMIHNGRIWKPDTGWRPYTGSDKHSGHVHVSFSRKDTSMASK